MNMIDKEGDMTSAQSHHTIDAPRVGPKTEKAADAIAAPEGVPRSETAAGSAAGAGSTSSADGAANPNPGFDMQQPHELAPRDRLAVPDAADQGAPGGSEPTAAPSVDEGGTPVAGSALSREQLEQMTADIIAALKTVYDPEIPSDIYELGLIYKIDIKDNRDVEVDMTLTAPACPVAGEMPQWVENAVRSVAGVGDVTVNLVFSPPWDPSRMSDEARLALNMF